MSRCENCGANLIEKDSLCPNCGTDVSQVKSKVEEPTYVG